jgi:hypothetical protein
MSMRKLFSFGSNDESRLPNACMNDPIPTDLDVWRMLSSAPFSFLASNLFSPSIRGIGMLEATVCYYTDGHVVVSSSWMVIDVYED